MLTKVSNMNSYKAPTLWVTIDDLKIPVGVPSLDMTESLLEKLRLVADLKNGLTMEGYDHIFDCFAAILSCNHNYLQFTAEDLKKKNLTVEQILGVFADWTAFIGTIASLKN